jgi:glutaconate CoA-transferase subunit A
VKGPVFLPDVGRVQDYVPSGSTIGIGGVGSVARPVSLCAAVAAGPSSGGLTVVELFGGICTEILIRAEKVGRVRSSFVSLEAYGLAPAFRSAVERGTIEFVEDSELSLLQALRAAAMSLPFIPVPDFVGTTAFEERNDVRLAQSPFGNEWIAVVPPLHLDVALVHGLVADNEGNVVLPDAQGIDVELCAASDVVVASVEQIVPHLEGAAQLPAFMVTAIVSVRRGAAPGALPPLYGPDVPALIALAEWSSM